VRGHADNGTTAFSPAFYRDDRDVALALGEALWRGQPREEVFARHASARASYELGSWVEELRVPAMIAVGGDDNAARGASTPLHAAHRLADRVPNATLQLFPGARHMLPWEVPAELTAALRSFVAKHPQG
jgi:pimeloyl-ACP methyl ester carboxylesterase